MTRPSLFAVHPVGSVKLLAAVVHMDEEAALEEAAAATGWPGEALQARHCGTVDVVPVVALERELDSPPNGDET